MNEERSLNVVQKFEKKNLNTITPGKIRSLFESAEIQLNLRDLEVEQIFINEFSVNARRSSFYGWSKCERVEAPTTSQR